MLCASTHVHVGPDGGWPRLHSRRRYVYTKSSPAHEAGRAPPPVPDAANALASRGTGAWPCQKPASMAAIWSK